jgi:subtilisin family serine protease
MLLKYRIPLLLLGWLSGVTLLSAQRSYLLRLDPSARAEDQLRGWLSAGQSLRVVSARWGLYELDGVREGDGEVLRRMPGVLYVGPNRPVQLRGAPEPREPNDPRFAQQWNLSRIGAPEAWGYTTGGLSPNGDTLVVAILDAGCDTGHPDLAANLFRNWAEVPGNGLDDDLNGYVDDRTGWDVRFGGDGHPRSEHGTSVSGIIGAAGDNGEGISGVCWAVKLLPVTLTNLTEAEVIAAYDYVLTMRELYHASGGLRGAYIVATNASFGVDYGRPADYPLWCAVFDSLGAAGILNVAATANLNVNVDAAGDIPTACTSPYLLSVTATALNDGRDPQAAYGAQSVDLAAPGGPFLATKANGFYNDFQGTSAAAPQVAGAVALLASLPARELGERLRQDPAAAALLLKSAILDGAEPNNSLQGRTVSGGRLQLARSIEALGAALGIDGAELSATAVSANPASEQVDIQLVLPVPGPFAWALANAGGAVVARGAGEGWGGTLLQVPLHGLPKGMYFFWVENGGKRAFLKMLKG